MDSSIRRATIEDAEVLARLGAATFRQAYAGTYPPDVTEAFLDSEHSPAKLRATLADAAIAVWIAEADGRPIGYAQAGPPDIPHPDVRPGHGELKRLYLLADAQGEGLGGRLIETALAWLEQAGRTPVWLGVWAEGHAAQRFYARYGFAKVGEYGWPMGDITEPAFIMRRG